jgi:hypothetical protein
MTPPSATPEPFATYITTGKSRQQMCDEYGISYKIFRQKLKFYNILLPPGLIMPKHQAMIYEAFGLPIHP